MCSQCRPVDHPTCGYTKAEGQYVLLFHLLHLRIRAARGQACTSNATCCDAVKARSRRIRRCERFVVVHCVHSGSGILGMSLYSCHRSIQLQGMELVNPALQMGKKQQAADKYTALLCWPLFDIIYVADTFPTRWDSSHPPKSQPQRPFQGQEVSPCLRRVLPPSNPRHRCNSHNYVSMMPFETTSRFGNGVDTGCRSVLSRDIFATQANVLRILLRWVCALQRAQH